MMDKIKILIVDDSSQTREDLRRLLYFEKDVEVIGEAANGQEAMDSANSLHPHVILMDINMPVMDGITASENISLKHPEIAIIITSIQSEHAYLKRAMMAGAREFLVKPFSSGELIDTIRKIYDIECQRQAGSVAKAGDTTLERHKLEKQVFAIQSLKGGVGKSVIASNLAVALQMRNQGSVALVDLDIQGGDMAVMLNLMPKMSLAELAQEKDIDLENLKTSMVIHQSGVSVLTAPLRPEQGEAIHGDEIEKILKLLKENFQYVVIDTPPYFHETNLAAFDFADKILVIAAPDLPAIKNVKVGLETLNGLSLKEKIILILNRSNQEVGIYPQDIESSLGIKIFAHIPSDGKTVIGAINRGQPFVTASPSSKISQTLISLAKNLIGEVNDSTPQNGLMKKIFGR